MMGPINCSQIHWLFRKSDEETAVDLVKSGRTNLTQAAREKADRLTVSSNCSLIIQRVSAADVGTYYCQNKDPKETMHTVALFLVNSEYIFSALYQIITKYSAQSPANLRSLFSSNSY